MALLTLTPEEYRRLIESGQHQELEESVSRDSSEMPTAAAKKLRELEREASSRSLAAPFESTWAHLGGPFLKTEFYFHPSRRWRADYCHEESRTLIELDGGIWLDKSGHKGQGQLDDFEKGNAALLEGYVLFRLGTGQITIENIEPIIEYCKDKE